MKNIDMLKKNMSENQTDRLLSDFAIYNEGYDTSLMELINELISEVCGTAIEFWSILDFVDWCNKEQYTMSQEVLNCLRVFNKSNTYEYITKDCDNVYFHIYEDIETDDFHEEVILTELGFQYDDFDFLEEGKTYNIRELVDNANKKFNILNKSR